MHYFSHDQDAPVMPGMTVALGRRTMKAYVVAPRQFTVLGLVQLGLEYSLLARSVHGDYVRVNGSVVRALDTERVEQAIRVATEKERRKCLAEQGHDMAEVPPVAEPSVVTVVVKRRRLALPQACLEAA